MFDNGQPEQEQSRQYQWTGNYYEQQPQQNIPVQQQQIYYHDQPYQEQQFTHSQNLDLLPDTKVPLWRIWLISIAFAALHIVVLNGAAILVGVIMWFSSMATTQEEIMNLFLGSDLQNWACIVMFFICTPIYIVFLNKRNKKFQGSVALKKVKPGPAISMIVVAFGSLGMVTGLLSLLEFLSNHVGFIAKWLQDYINLTEMIVSEEGNLLLQIIATVILVPIAEELLFRGIIQGELNLRFTPRVAVLIQALLFGIFHMNPIQSLYTFIPGLLLGIAYYYTGNLIIPIVMHMIFNLVGGVFNVILSETIMQWLSYVELVIGIFAIVVVVLFFVKAKPDSDHKLKWQYTP